MRKIYLSLIIIASLALCACSATFSNSLGDMETTQINGESGYTVTLPADWDITTADTEDEYLQYSCISPDGQATLLIYAELGGMEYYSLQELGELLCGELQDSLYSQNTLDDNSTKDRYHAVLSGEDKDGGELVSIVNLIEPYTAVYYYLLFTASSAYYNNNSQLLDEIVDSFSMTMTEDELYAYIAAQREAQAAAELAAEDEPTDELTVQESDDSAI